MHAQVAPWSVFDGPPRGPQRFGRGRFVRVAQGGWSLRCQIGSPTLCQVLSLWVEAKGTLSPAAVTVTVAVRARLARVIRAPAVLFAGLDLGFIV